MAEVEEAPRRSPSQLSHTSSKSSKTRSRPRQRKSPSSASSIVSPKPDPSLTSFPSLAPDAPAPDVPEQPLSQQTLPNRTVSQRIRERKATLKGLTNSSPPLTGRNALFEDSPRSSLDVPGALHLAHDDHIQRLIARTGAVKLVRQFALDLAQRDAEISALRVRVDLRERELKRMLREVEVSSADIEKRLKRLEVPEDGRSSGKSRAGSPGLRRGASTLDGMIQEALLEEVGKVREGHVNTLDASATVRPSRSDSGNKSRKSTGESTKDSGLSGSSWQNQVWESNSNSRHASTSSSIISHETEQTDSTAKPRQSSGTRRKGLNNLFQPPASSGNSYFIGGKARTNKKQSNADDSSVHSRQSTRSTTSWTMRLFGGSAVSKDGASTDNSRPRSSSLGQGASTVRASSSTAAESAMAVLTQNAAARNTSSTVKSSSSRNTGTVRGGGSTVRKPAAIGNLHENSPEQTKSVNPEDLGPVEMDAIIPIEAKPPTMTQSSNPTQVDGLLTDRFGFIYDQRQRKRREGALAAAKQAQRGNEIESIGTYRRESDAAEQAAQMKLGEQSATGQRPVTPASMDDRADAGAKRWQDYLKISSLSRPAELLLHTPSAGAIVTVSTADASGMITPPSARSTSSVTVGEQRLLPTASSPAEPNISLATASTSESAAVNSSTDVQSTSSPSLEPAQTDQEPVKLLLDRLTKLHDSLQAEKEVKWNEFLRKVRAERSVSTSTDRPSRVTNAPEAEIVNGELIGIATLGRPSKTNRNKYMQFKTLVLQGIPVSLRPKIWSECSGATARRSPGYYLDLIARVEAQTDLDTDIVSQINADIGRTLTDNTFFRHGPGVARLQALLLAYSIHNPTVGYCQGMNLITASLLLIMPSSEDAFWILVAVIENILPAGYFDRGLLVARADQIVLRGYVGEVLPRLGAQFEALGVELEACSFMWFLSLFTGCLSAEALYRVWDVVLCLNSSEAVPGAKESVSLNPATGSTTLLASSNGNSNSTPNLPTAGTSSSSSPTPPSDAQSGTSSPFLFQLSLALLKLNEPQLLALDSAAAVYSYVNHSMTNHAISIDALVAAAEALRKVVRREDVLARRERAVGEIGGVK